VADDILSSFLIKIVYDQDEKSRKKFDAGLKSIQDNAQEFGKKIEALPAIVHEATKKISLSLTSLYYAAQQTRATEQELHAFSRGIKDSGGDVDQANASYKAFVENLNVYGSGLTRSIQEITKVTVDAEHPMEGYIAVWDKLHEMFMRGGEDRAKAGKYAEAFNIPVEQLALGREQFHKSFLEDIGRTGAAYGEAAKQASLLQIALNKLEAAFSNVVTKADVAIMNDYAGALDRISDWVDDNQEKVIKFIKDFVEQFRIAFHELKDTFGPTVEWLGGVIKDAFASLDKFLGNDDGGVKGLRIALESLFAMSLLAGLARLGATLTLAMLPVTKFMLAAMALGLLGAGAYALYQSYVDHDALAGGGGGSGGWGIPGGGRGGETILAGRTGVHREGGAGTSGSGYRGGPAGRPNANFTAENAKALREAAARIGTTPEDLATVIGYETEGTFSPSKWGGAGGRYMGLIQFGPPERAQYGANENQTFAEQLGAVERYLKGRGFKPGMGINDLYSTILAGRPGLNRADSGGTVNQHVARMQGAMAARARLFLKSGAQESGVHWDPHFDRALRVFKNAKPQGTDQQHSMNQVHDHRVVQSETNIHVAGEFPVEKTRHPLDRPRLADVIRNTSSYVS
jgi:hypothetical protein